MRPTIIVTLMLLAAGLSLVSRDSVGADAALSLVINPRTGATSIRNDSGASLSIDGYLLTSTSAVFNPLGWSSFANNGIPNWQQGPAAANRLGEANLFSSRNVNANTSLNLGSLYLPVTPTEIGQLEPSLTFEYHVAGAGSVVGDVVFAPQNNLTLLIDPVSGNASLQNQSNFDVNIDGLLITSPDGVLDPVGWNGLAESGTVGWASGATETNRLGEANLLGSKFLPRNGTPIPIGKPINASLIDDETDLLFEYHLAGGGSITGGVTFLATAVQPILGDYNGNGSVDAADYTIWRNSLGSTIDLRANGDNSGASAGKIDQADYLVWKANFGMGGGAGGLATQFAAPAAAIPEPSCWWLGCSMGLGLSSAVRFRCKHG